MRRINFRRQGGGVSRSGATSNDDNADEGNLDQQSIILFLEDSLMNNKIYP